MEDVLDVPYMWIGTAAEIAARLHRHRQRWDISRYVVRAPAIDAATQVMAQLG